MDQSDWNARVAKVAEAGEVARLLHNFNTEFDTPSPRPEILVERLKTLMPTNNTFAILAGVPAVALALVTLRTNVWYEGRVALLDELYVEPQLRGKGIGSAIVAQLLTTARTLGVDSIEVGVDEVDIDARRFYTRHGFSSTDPESTERSFAIFQELST